MYPVVAVELAAVVLAGGRSRRLGGVDKVALRVGGRTLLDRTLEAVAGAAPIVVVGPCRPVATDVVWTREDPAGSGPLSGLRAGLMAVRATTGLVAILAADHPHVTAETVARLADAVSANPTASGAVLTDPDGRAQWLVGVWRIASLWDRMPAEVRERPVRVLLEALEPQWVPALGAEATDVDTPEDFRRATDPS
jgi:molybdopterin-guanine dinucleotide biosynthesis protein A